MPSEVEILNNKLAAQNKALWMLNDEIMSMLHARPLNETSIPSAKVREWLQLLYDLVQDGFGKPPHFTRMTP